MSLQQWAITWGILIQYFIQYGASFTGGGSGNVHQGTSAFRIPWAIQIVPAAILFAGMFFMPYTPRWLAAQDRWEESIRVLANLHGKGDIGHPNVLAQYREIEEVLRFEREEALNTFRALTQPRMLNRVVIGISVQMWSQLVGMNMMVSSGVHGFWDTDANSGGSDVLHCVRFQTLVGNAYSNTHQAI